MSTIITDSTLQPRGQWEDFHFRQMDPYAFAKYDVLMNWLGQIKTKSALVVGSGSGEFAALLALAGAKTLAIDIDEPSIRLTDETAKRYGAEVTTQVSHLEDFKSAQLFDIVVATDVIEHIEDDRAASENLKRLVKPGGSLIITVPALQWLFGLHDESLGHYRRYSRTTLLRLFDSGVRIEKIRYFGFFLIPIPLILSRWLRRPYPTQVVGSSVKKKGFVGRVLEFVFAWEKAVSMPLGTSLLMFAKVDAGKGGGSFV